MTNPLIQGVPGIVIMVHDDVDVVQAAEGVMSRLDDAEWARQLRRPFSWQLFLNWWVARRYITPRDVRLSWR